MLNSVGAILLDTRSIQKYVFSCNRLKTNIGASFLVDSIFSDLMVNKILPSLNLKMPEFSWNEVDNVQMLEDDSIECEVAYIGGGNMIILVRKQDEDVIELCKKIVGSWSKEILIKAPGLKTGAAIGMLGIDSEHFQKSLGILYKQLKDNQNTILPQVDVPYVGFTLECDYSGKTAEYLRGRVEDSIINEFDNKMVSAEIVAKSSAYNVATEKLKEEYKDILGNRFDFVTKFDNLGYKDNESYISVVHIDGNNMGIKFASCKNMQERKKLSLRTAQIVKRGFYKLLKSVVIDFKEGIYDKSLNINKMKNRYLPIRPIIIGGDDITFVCPGRLGLEYAKRFIQFVSKEQLLDEKLYSNAQGYAGKIFNNQNIKVNNNMSCCAGVAIVPAKYPFYRAYELAEQLCGSAKKKSREDDESFVDFAILHGDMSPTLDQLCVQQYEAPEGYLHYGPYCITQEQNDKSNINDLFSLIEKIKKVPNNKIKDLRNVLNEDNHSIVRFLENCPEVENILKDELQKEDVGASDLWQYMKNEKILKTRYVDAIELIDFSLKV